MAKADKVVMAWALAAMLAAPAGLGAQELVAWPMGTNPGLRVLLPGMPVRPMPIRPLPGPFPRPIPRPGPTPTPTPMPPRPEPEAQPLALSAYKVTGVVEDRTASLDFEIRFHNPTRSRLEGVLLVPIPADTAISGFQMTMGGKMVKGELLEADKAATIYQGIVNSMRDPGLLELVGERLLRARVFPIEPGGDITVRLTLTQVLQKSGELLSLSVPLKSARMLAGEKGKATARIEVRGSRPLRTLYTPTPDARVKRDGDRAAVVTYEEGDAPAQDLALFFSMQQDPLAANALAFREDGEDGYFLVSLAPKPEAEGTAATPRDIVFVVDRSGSMEEEGRMTQAKAALAFCIRKLAPRDRFGIVDFATDTSSFESRLEQATPQAKQRALRYVERLEAAGGTNIEGGLQDALALLQAAGADGAAARGRVPMLFFLTDGLPTIGQTDPQVLLKAAVEKNAGLKARLFSFGVGSDVNTLFLDKLAEMNRGARDYVLPGENIEHKVGALYQKVAKPALTDVRVEWRGLETAQVYPRKTVDLFHGSELVLMGRYRRGGKGTLVVTGKAGGRDARFEFPVELPGEAGRHAFLPRLWAGMKVSAELDAIRLSGKADPEVVRDIVKLAKRHGIVTPYTSYLITEEGTDFGRVQTAGLRAMEGLRRDAAVSGFDGRSGRAAQRASNLFSRMNSAVSMAASDEADMMAGAAALAPGGIAPGAALKSAALVRGAAGGGGAGAFSAGLDKAERETLKDLAAEGKTTTATRTVGSKTFYLRGGVWVDGDVEMEDLSRLKAQTVRALSPEYYSLLEREPGLRRYLALGTRLKVAYKGTVYTVTE